MNNENEGKKVFQAKDLYVYEKEYKGIRQIFILEGKKLSLEKNSDGYKLNDTIIAYFDIFTKQFFSTSDSFTPLPISFFIQTIDKKEDYTLLELKNIYKKYVGMLAPKKEQIGFAIPKIK